MSSLLSPGKQVPPIANAGRDVVVQPGTLVVLNGIESLPLGGAHITDYRWTLQSGKNNISIEVRWAGLTFVAVVQGDMKNSTPPPQNVLVLSWCHAVRVNKV